MLNCVDGVALMKRVWGTDIEFGIYDIYDIANLSDVVRSVYGLELKGVVWDGRYRNGSSQSIFGG